jgi:hypothetical protein
MNFQTMNKQRKFVLIAAAAGIIACFLPWVTVSVGGFGGGSVNGMHSWGLLAFIGFIGAGVAAFMGDQTKTMAQTYWFVALACSALAVLGVVIYFLRISSISGGGYFGATVSYGFGIFIAAAAAIASLGSAYMYRNPGDSIKGGFDSLKSDIEKKAE